MTAGPSSSRAAAARRSPWPGCRRRTPARGPGDPRSGRDPAEAGRAGLRVRGVCRSGQDDRVEPAIEPQGGRLGRLAGDGPSVRTPSRRPIAASRSSVSRVAVREGDRRSVCPIDIDQLGRRAARGDLGECIAQPIEGVAADTCLEGRPQPGVESGRSRPRTGRHRPGDRGEPAAHVVPLEIEGVVHIEDDAADHHFGLRGRSARRWRGSCSTPVSYSRKSRRGPRPRRPCRGASPDRRRRLRVPGGTRRRTAR